jgi:hypothetical protein
LDGAFAGVLRTFCAFKDARLDHAWSLFVVGSRFFASSGFIVLFQELIIGKRAAPVVSILVSLPPFVV